MSENKKALMICLDGCSPDYLERSHIPNIKSLLNEGKYCVGEAVVPTVTNVNSVSLITGVYPEDHGITSNCYYDREKAIEVYMESAQDIMAITAFEKIKQAGMVSALISVKDKLCTLLNKGADIVLSAENPPKWIIEELGSPPSIYSIEVNSWVLKAARVVLGKHAPNFTYVATTDYVEHKYDPSTHESKLHMELVDEEIGNIVEETNNLLLCIGADHGMGNKTKAVNLKSALGRAKVDSWVIPTVKDRYVPHHSNLSGSAYIYLSDKKQANKASSILYELEGVEHILTADCAATKYHLPNYKVGDFFILGDEETVFGEVSEDVVSDVGMRSHGSLHEKNVPIIVYNCYTDNIKIKENKDMIKIIMDWLI